MKTFLISIMSIAIIAVLVVSCDSKDKKTPEYAKNRIENMVDKRDKKCPEQIDAYTILESVTIDSENICYHYRIEDDFSRYFSISKWRGNMLELRKMEYKQDPTYVEYLIAAGLQEKHVFMKLRSPGRIGESVISPEEICESEFVNSVHDKYNIGVSSNMQDIDDNYTSAETDNGNYNSSEFEDDSPVRGDHLYCDDVDGYVNIRKEPNSKSEILEVLYFGKEYAEFIAQKGDWYQVRYKGKIGFVHYEHVHAD